MGERFQTILSGSSIPSSLFPSVPIMALSATLPPLEFLVSRDIGLRNPYLSVSLPLDRPNIFYAVKRKQGLSVDLASLVSCMKSAACPQQISKTVIFCLTKDSCHSVCPLVEKCVPKKTVLPGV